jgi:hypothetical protein
MMVCRSLTRLHLSKAFRIIKSRQGANYVAHYPELGGIRIGGRRHLRILFDFENFLPELFQVDMLFALRNEIQRLDVKSTLIQCDAFGEP